MKYSYGMRLRGFSPGCQPKDGLDGHIPGPIGGYWDILIYKRKLTDEELENYDLDYIGEYED